MEFTSRAKKLDILFKVGYEVIGVCSDDFNYSTNVIDLSNFCLNKYKQKKGYKSTKELYLSTYDHKVLIQLDYESDLEDVNSIYSLLDVNEIYNDVKFGIIEQTKDELLINVYKISCDKTTIDIEKKNNILITCNDDGFIFDVDGNKASLRLMKPIIKNISSYNISWFDALLGLVFNSHRKRLGFFDVFEKIKEIVDVKVNKKIASDEITYETLCYMNYFATKNMYLIMEKITKLNLPYNFYDYNPVISNYSEVPNPDDIKMLSKKSLEVMKKSMSENREFRNTLLQMESNPAIGVNGISNIYDLYTAYEKINFDYSCELNGFNIYSIYRITDFYTHIQQIMGIFDISVKTLCERIIKTSFYENICPIDFLQIIMDYIDMSNSLKIEIPKKLPKDVVKRHDLLQAEIKYLEDKETEKLFMDNVIKNKKLLNVIPENKDFTIISPDKPNDLINEGLLMHHCVGTYINRYATGDSKIFFVRKKSDINTPFVTIELNRRNMLVQASEYSNSRPHKIVMDFLTKWEENIKEVLINE